MPKGAIEKQKTSEYVFKHYLEGDHAYFESLMELRNIELSIEITKACNAKNLKRKCDNILKKVECHEILLSIPKTH